MSEKNVYRVRLLRWGDSSSSGRTVTFKLPDDEEDHPFKGLDVGSKNGQLLEMEIAIYDGEGDVETLGRIRKPRARSKPSLPVIKDETTSGSAPEAHRKRARMENVTRRIIKPASEAPAPSAAAAPAAIPPLPQPQILPETAPPPTSMAPAPQSAPWSGDGTGNGSANGTDTGGGNLDAGDLDVYASQMGQAAEALAAVAERLDDQEDNGPQFPTMPGDADDNVDPGIRAVRRAVDLCKAIDKQRAGFYYFMRSRYPEAPKVPGEEGNWSRDAKSTRDRVCLHCEATELDDLAQDHEARKKFEELETEFERHERLR
ncbi:hypothetical protein L2D14_07795 [Thalassospiraceae bacterium LMO-JJ14]|nr:hypothetical protein L2D14_07795 [Thalassospiraceae bacterium LMO-JJ14]